MKQSKKMLVLTALLFGLLMTLPEIVLGSTITLNNDSCICYTTSQDKRCLECLINTVKKDSLNQNLQLQILNFKEVVRNDRELKLMLNNKVSVLEKDLILTRTKLKISKRLTMFGVPIALGGGFLIAVLLR